MSTKARQTASKAPQSVALHIGLNEVSAAAYAGWTGPLAACEFDARDMAALSKQQGFKSTVLLTQKATRAAVLSGIRKAAKALGAGGFFLLTYSGHGGQVPDISGEEADKQDETWCLFDGQLIDDELYFELSQFKAGVRIVVVSDSCHSGTVVRAGPPQAGAPSLRPKLMPPAVARRVYGAHQAFYDKLQTEVSKASGKAIADPDTALANVAISGRLTAIVKQFRPKVILLSGCQDNQFSMDGDNNGAFTEQLLRVWNHGQFTGSYASFHARILAAMPPAQSPNLFTLGKAGLFLKESPFKP